MFDVAGKNDRLANLAAVFDTDAAFHQVAKDLAIGWLVVDRLVDAFLFILKIGRKDAVFFQLSFLLIIERVVLDTIAKELGRERDDFEWIQETRVVFDGFPKFITGGRVFALALEHVERAFANELNWRRCQTDLMAIEVLKQLLVSVVKTSV